MTFSKYILFGAIALSAPAFTACVGDLDVEPENPTPRSQAPTISTTNLPASTEVWFSKAASPLTTAAPASTPASSGTSRNSAPTKHSSARTGAMQVSASSFTLHGRLTTTGSMNASRVSTTRSPSPTSSCATSKNTQACSPNQATSLPKCSERKPAQSAPFHITT